MDNENLKKIIEFVKSKKTTYTRLINISKLENVIFDYILIISMDNIRSVDSIKDDIIDFIYQNHIKIKSIDSKSKSWIVIDLFDYVIHIFNEKEREYYNLEKNWADGEMEEIK